MKGLFLVFFYVLGICVSQSQCNLVINNSFEFDHVCPPVGYLSDLNCRFFPEVGSIMITSNARAQHGCFWTDSAAKEGSKYLLGDAASTNKRAWYTNVTVCAGITYTFSAWVRNVSRIGRPGCTQNSNGTWGDPSLQLRIGGINGEIIASSGAIPEETGWHLMTGQWTATSSETIEIDIVSLASSGIGFDFGIDDVSFIANVSSPPPFTQLDSLVCSGSDATIRLTGGTKQFFWYSSFQSQNVISTDTFLTFSDVQKDTTVYVEMTYENGCCRTERKSASIKTRQPVDIDLGPDTSVCPKTTVIFTVPDLGLQTEWSNGVTGNTVTIKDSGLVHVRVGSPGCAVSDSIRVFWNETNYNFTTVTACLNELPLTIIGKNLTKEGLYSDTLTNIYGCDSIVEVELIINNTYQQVIDSTISTPLFFNNQFLTESGIYTQKFVSTLGCDSTVSLVISVRELIIPNVYTPNGDGVNDRFEIKNHEFYKPLSLSVFNRWGSLIYKNENYNNEWDGKNLTTGLYFYNLKINDEKTYKGWVQIEK